MKFNFDLQLFGGGKGGSTTVQNNYRPLTEAEKAMQQLSLDYAKHIQPSAYKLYDNAMSGIQNTLNPSPDYNSLYATQKQATAQNTQTASDIANGVLPQAYADNRNAQAKQYAKTSLGDLLGNKAKSGVVNSSVMDKGISNMETNLANTFQNSYTSDLSTASGLLANKQNYDNLGIQQANQAEQASYQMPLQLLAASQGQFQPTTNIWQPTLMSNQANPISSTTSSSGGKGSGLFGGIAQGVGSFYGAGGCFPADTMITTPTGDKPVQEIEKGDLVYGFNDDNQIIIEKVLTIAPEHSEKLIEVITDDGSFKASHSQNALTRECGLLRLDELEIGDTLYHIKGNKVRESKITKLVRHNDETKVYDFITKTNLFFANGFVVDGYDK